MYESSQGRSGYVSGTQSTYYYFQNRRHGWIDLITTDSFSTWEVSMCPPDKEKPHDLACNGPDWDKTMIDLRINQLYRFPLPIPKPRGRREERKEYIYGHISIGEMVSSTVNYQGFVLGDDDAERRDQGGAVGRERRVGMGHGPLRPHLHHQDSRRRQHRRYRDHLHPPWQDLHQPLRRAAPVANPTRSFFLFFG